MAKRYLIGATDECVTGSIATMCGHIEAVSPDNNEYIAANTMTLHPCLTRDLMAARGGFSPNDTQRFSMMTFDDLGCRVDPSRGWRMPEDCGINPLWKPENRNLCPGIPYDHPSIEDKIRHLKFWKAVLPFLLKLVPIVGQAIAEAIAPLLDYLMEQIGDAAAAKLNEEIKRLIEVLIDAIIEIFAALRAALVAAKQTFKTLGISVKTLVDAFPKNAFGMDPRTSSLLAYAGAREALSFGTNLLKGNAPSLKMLRALSVNAPLNVFDFASARIAQDARKILVTTVATGEFVRDARGTLNPTVFDNFLNVEMKPVQQITANGGSLGGLPLNLSADLTQKFAGKPVETLQAFQVDRLMDFVPSVPGRDVFQAEIKNALDYERLLSPYMKQAEQVYGADLDAIKLYAKSKPPMKSPGDVREWEKSVRVKLQEATTKADRIIQSGIIQFAPYEMGVY